MFRARIVLVVLFSFLRSPGSQARIESGMLKDGSLLRHVRLNLTTVLNLAFENLKAR